MSAGTDGTRAGGVSGLAVEDGESLERLVAQLALGEARCIAGGAAELSVQSIERAGVVPRLRPIGGVYAWASSLAGSGAAGHTEHTRTAAVGQGKSKLHSCRGDCSGGTGA